MPALPYLLPVLTLAAAACGFAAARAMTRINEERQPEPPPRGFKPVVINGGKISLPPPVSDVAP